jgi:pyruvate/2-oxoglutarate dehydrogenase complex dihydrolipoamide acyltransferase (E2) component
MAKQILVPQVGQDIEEATVVRWLKNIGDEVNVGDVVLEVESDKALLQVEAYEKGILVKRLAEKGDLVKVLTPVAYLE